MSYYSPYYYKIVLRAESSSYTVNLPQDKLDVFTNKLCKITLEQMTIKQLTLIETDVRESIQLNVNLSQPYGYSTFNNTNQTIFLMPINQAVTSDYVYTSQSSQNGILANFQPNFTFSLVDKNGTLLDKAYYTSWYAVLRVTPLVEVAETMSS